MDPRRLAFLAVLGLLASACTDDPIPIRDCGGPCPTGQVCRGGACTPATCDDATACPVGLSCVDGACVRPPPECRDDDDCPGGRCVEGVCYAAQCADGDTRPCETACGTGEQRCRDGVWRTCTAREPAPTEICGDGVDDDCDGEIDEGCEGCEDGATRPCESACGDGKEHCVMGSWTDCDAPRPGPELCDDGLDGDCDGEIDEDCAACEDGVKRPCATECGQGEETCAGGEWGGCTAPAPVGGECPGDGPTCDDETRKPTGDVRLSPPGGDAYFPRALWTGTDTGVFWTDGSGDGSRTLFARVTPLGGPAGAAEVLFERSFHDAAWTGNGYLVLTVAIGRLSVARVSRFGRALGQVDHRDLTRSGLDAAVAWNGRELGAVWSDNLEDLYFARFDADGRLAGGPVRLTAAPGRSMDPSLVATPDGWALAFRDERDDPDDRFDSRVYFVRLAPDGRERAPEVGVADGEMPSLAWTGAGFGLAFVDARDRTDDVWFVALDAEGRRRGEDRPVSESPHNARAPSLVWTGDGFGVAWGDSRHDGQAELYFARLDPDGARRGDPVRLTDAPADSGYPSLTWTGEAFGVAWTDERDAADPHNQADIYFAAGPFTCPD